MIVYMPVQVLCGACCVCSDLKIAVEKDYSDGKMVSSQLECVNYDRCLQVVEVWKQSLVRPDPIKEEEEGKTDA